MEIQINAVSEPVVMKASDMPLGSIGRVTGVALSDLYVVRTQDNGDKYICLWPHSQPAGIEARSPSIVDNMTVALLPKGSSILLKF